MSINKKSRFSKKNAALIAIAAICFVLFFVGGPDYYSPRSYKRFWDLGHILFFFILTYFIFVYWPRNSKTTFLRQSIFAIIITICLGSLIELAQTESLRTPDLMDLARDIIGCLIALAFYAPNRNAIPKTVLKTFQTISLILLAIAFLPLIAAIIDETAARNQFPVLADFETRFETDRLTGTANFSIDHKIHFHGNGSLRVVLNTSHYSGIALNYFPENWMDYKELQFSIYNPDKKPIHLTCRIHDRRHSQGQQLYSDRFNKNFSISNGWNLIRIPLEEILNAPYKRKIALNQIQGLAIFAVSLSKPRTVYIDYVRLVNTIPEN